MTPLTRWQKTTLVTLTVGYAGYYFCRTNLSVATPLILEEFQSRGLGKAEIGLVVSAGVFLYAVGKLVTGALCDFVGGRRMFLLGMVLSVLATVLFGLSTGLATFLMAWSFNRLVQSMGWGALVKIASAWFPPERMGTIMGILALSYLFGDAVAKLALGQLLVLGLGWRGIFFSSAVILAVIALGTGMVLKASPVEVGEAEPRASAANLYGERGNESRPESLADLLLPLLRSPAFILVCVMSFGLTVLRETFNFWTPTYLVEAAGLSQGDAARWSGAFPFFGGLSILVAGYLSDRLFAGKRGPVMFLFLLPAVGCLLGLAALGSSPGATLPVLLIALIGFLMIGPYAFLSGAISVDLGGKKASSTAAGVADAVGYFGSVVSGWGIGQVATQWGWGPAMSLLAVVGGLTVITSGFYWWQHDRVTPEPSR